MRSIYAAFLGLHILVSTNAQSSSYRLPGKVRPSHYDLTIETNIAAFTFNGSVSIAVTVLQPTDVVTLHAKDLSVSYTGSGTNIPLLNETRSDVTDFYELRFNSTLAPNSNHTLDFAFNGNLGTENAGYYRASFIDEFNQTRNLAVTHLEATNARRAFPCFDQPNLKATFSVTLIRPSNYSSTANMPQQSSTSDPADPTKFRDTYVTSVIMPTYLVAFLVSDYANASAYNDSYRVFGRPELLNRDEAAYALHVGRESIETMQEFTGVNYTIGKLDQVAVPNDYYRIGAMENWGLVTYRERNLMYNENTSTAAEKQRTAIIIAHEIAHQWFGNLVTLEWWSYIWLNEGFATFFEIQTSALIETGWSLIDQFQISVLQEALEDDAYETSRPMTRVAESQAEIAAIYDTIVYEKAGSVIKMVKAFLGETAFYTGLTAYLQTWSYGNVVPQNLYQSWQNATSDTTLNVSLILTSWETQSGYPVVDVIRNYSSGIVTFGQARFLVNNATHNDNSLWHIPINWFTPTVTNNNYTWLSQNTLSLNLGVPANNWIIVNNNREGFYRVNYDDANWELIANTLQNNFTQIPVVTRNQLIDDAFNLARSGRLSYSVAFKIGAYVVNETDYVPIYTFTNALSYLERTLTGHAIYTYLQTYALNILTGIYSRTGFDILHNDTHLTKLTKVTVLTWLCNLGHPECRNRSSQAFISWVNNGTPIQPDAQNFVFCNGLRESTSTAQWEAAFSQYLISRDDTHRSRLASALGCFNGTTDSQSLLQLLLNETSQIESSHRGDAFSSVISNNGVSGVDVALNWLLENYTQANKRISSLGSHVNNIARRITTYYQLSKLHNFRNTRSGDFSESLNATITQAITTAEFNLLWINTTSDHIRGALNGEDSNDSNTTTTSTTTTTATPPPIITTTSTTTTAAPPPTDTTTTTTTTAAPPPINTTTTTTTTEIHPETNTTTSTTTTAEPPPTNTTTTTTTTEIPPETNTTTSTTTTTEPPPTNTTTTTTTTEIPLETNTTTSTTTTTTPPPNNTTTTTTTTEIPPETNTTTSTTTTPTPPPTNTTTTTTTTEIPPETNTTTSTTTTAEPPPTNTTTTTTTTEIPLETNTTTSTTTTTTPPPTNTTTTTTTTEIPPETNTTTSTTTTTTPPPTNTTTTTTTTEIPPETNTTTSTTTTAEPPPTNTTTTTTTTEIPLETNTTTSTTTTTTPPPTNTTTTTTTTEIPPETNTTTSTTTTITPPPTNTTTTTTTTEIPLETNTTTSTTTTPTPPPTNTTTTTTTTEIPPETNTTTSTTTTTTPPPTNTTTTTTTTEIPPETNTTTSTTTTTTPPPTNTTTTTTTTEIPPETNTTTSTTTTAEPPPTNTTTTTTTTEIPAETNTTTSTTTTITPPPTNTTTTTTTTEIPLETNTTTSTTTTTSPPPTNTTTTTTTTEIPAETNTTTSITTTTAPPPTNTTTTTTTTEIPPPTNTTTTTTTTEIPPETNTTTSTTTTTSPPPTNTTTTTTTTEIPAETNTTTSTTTTTETTVDPSDSSSVIFSSQIILILFCIIVLL